MTDYLRVTKSFCYICNVLRDEVLRKCLTSCEIAKSLKGYTRHGDSSYCGLPFRAYIQVFGDAYKSVWMVAHFLFFNVLFFGWLPSRNSCKNRYYEEILFVFCIPNDFRNNGYGRVVCATS